MARKKTEEVSAYQPHTKGAALYEADSCLSAAAEDEPIFILRANDELAPQVIRYWSELYLSSKRGINRGELNEIQLKKYYDAYEMARDMETWKNNSDLPLPEVSEDENDGA